MTPATLTPPSPHADPVDRHAGAAATKRALDVSIVIVSWNTCDLLRDCLESITRHAGATSGALEVIVVDNASSDGTPEMVARCFPHVRLIANDDNRGFAAANNQALREMRGRYALLLNPDTVVLDDVITRSIEYADARPDIAVVGCRVMQSDTEVQRTCFRFPSVSNMMLFALGLTGKCHDSTLAGRAAYGGWNRDCERDVDVVSGMFMLVRRDAIEQVGCMDDAYFVYAEEADWCRRFHDAGWRCVFAPVGHILHVDGGGRSTEQVSVRMYVQLQKSLMIYHRTHGGRLGAVAARVLFVLAMAGRAVWWGGRRISGRSPHARRRWDQALAALRFHVRGHMPS